MGVRTEPEHGPHQRSPLLTLRATPCTGDGRRPYGPRAPGALQTLLGLCLPWQPGLGQPGPGEPVPTALFPGPCGAASPPGQRAGPRVGPGGVRPPREPVPLSRDSEGLLFPQVSAARRGCGGGRAHFLSARFLLPAGLWLYLAGSSLPCLTLIGSPNFGYRSVHRDLEAQIAIVTESRALQQQLHQVGWGCGAVGAQLGAWGLSPAGARGWERTGVL